MSRHPLLLSIAFAAVALALAACGGKSPTAPSAGGSGAVLHGVALGADATASSARGARAMSGAGKITVTVKEDPSISTKVSANGTFELENLPAGTLTLEFSVDGKVVGTVTITGVSGDVEIKLTVQITATVVVVVDLEMDGGSSGDTGDAKTCAISGGTVGKGIELEGTVDSVTGTSLTMKVNGERASALVTVDASDASFKCNGGAGSSDNGKDNGKSGGTCDATSLAAGEQIHVRGTLLACTTTDAQVIATEVMIQHGEGSDD